MGQTELERMNERLERMEEKQRLIVEALRSWVAGTVAQPAETRSRIKAL